MSDDSAAATRRALRRRTATWLGILAAGVLAVAVIADVLVPPARAGQQLTLYVDRRIGNDSLDGRTPENALKTLAAAVRRSRPDTQILVMGYGTRLAYPGTETGCITLRGKPGKPITIRRNVFTNTLYPAVFTAGRTVPGPWTRVPGPAGSRTWQATWPDPIRMGAEPDDGFVKLGAIGVTGYPSTPPASVTDAAWWANGHVFIRQSHYDPNNYPILIKNGDGLCLSGRSRHVRIDDLMVVGAVHAVRVEPGAVDVHVTHLVRQNVLDPDFRGDHGDRDPAGAGEGGR